MQESKALSIVIVNYKSKDHLGVCVGSIFNKLGSVNFEILLINNDQEENVPKDLLNLPEIKVINNQENIGFAAAANIGARQASGEWLLFLNPDTKLLTNQTKIVEFAKERENLGILSPQLLDEKGEAQRWSWGKMPNLLQLFKNNIGNRSNTGRGASTTALEVDWVSGAAMFVKREVFKKLGGFDEKFFMYFEDIDLCKRAKDIGIKTAYFPEEKVEHLGGKSVENKKKQKEDYYNSQDHYFRKHHGKVSAFILKFLRKIFEKNHV